MVGPPFLNNMCSIILQFRTYTYGLSTDNEKAFLHVGLNMKIEISPDSSGYQTQPTPRASLKYIDLRLSAIWIN